MGNNQCCSNPDQENLEVTAKSDRTHKMNHNGEARPMIEKMTIERNVRPHNHSSNPKPTRQPLQSANQGNSNSKAIPEFPEHYFQKGPKILENLKSKERCSYELGEYPGQGNRVVEKPEILSDGNLYIGEEKQGQKQGRGRLLQDGGGIYFEGYFDKDVFHGPGCLFLANGDYARGEFLA